MMSQLLGMIRYEFKMAWRRGAIRLIVFVTLLMPLIGYALFTVPNMKAQDVNESQLSEDMVLRLHTARALSDNIFLVPILVFLVPMLVAETIPLDRQYRMAEIVRALPLSTGTYLAGKVMAAALPVMGSVTLAALISLIINLLRQGSVDTGPVLMFWLGGVLVLALFGVITGVMVPARQPDRRRAILFGGIAALLCTVAYIALPLNEILFTAMIQSTVIDGSAAIDIARLPTYPNLLSGPYLMRYQLMIAILVLLCGFVLWRFSSTEPAV
jgi:hypothetical protein